MIFRTVTLLIITVLSAEAADRGSTHTVTPTSVPLTREFKGTLIPVKPKALRLEFKHWPEAGIKKIAGHGTSVKQWQEILTLDSSKLDMEILRTQAKQSKVSIEAAKVKQAISHLEKSMPLRLEAGLLKKKAATENLAFFQNALEPLQRKKSEKSLKDMEKALKYTQAEYDQLKKMYSEDQVTEETEEIILERQKDRLRHRKFAVEELKVKSKQELTYLIPRELQKLKTAKTAAELEYEKLKVDLPAEMQQLKVELQSLQVSQKSLSDILSKLQADRMLMTVKAPLDGILYYGTFSETGWNTKISPSLKPGKTLMNGSLWGTLIPFPSVEVNVKIKEYDVSLLSTGTIGRGTVDSVPGVIFDATLENVSDVPVSAGEYLATFSVSVPEGRRLLPGQTISISMTAKLLENALIVPDKFVHRDKANHLQPYVWLKTGKDVVKQPVITGISTGKGIQITNGLKAGNIILKTTPKEPCLIFRQP